jgi:hypothetical protein
MFNWKIYRENRKTKITDLYPDFNLENYKQANSNLKLNTDEEYELHYIKEQQQPKELKVVVVAIFKNEAHILEEWIQHYLREGVDTFLLIDNDSDDNYMDILKKYIDAGKVILNIDKERYKQIQHYNNYYLNKVKNEYDWVLLVDLDEFIYARNGFNTIKDYLKSLDNNVAQIFIPMKLYGSSGFIEQPKLVVENFIKRKIYKTNQSMYTKTIMRCNKLKRFDNHSSQIINGIEISATNNTRNNNYKNRCLDTISEDILKKSYLHLNHYEIQSWDWFKIKMTRGSALTKTPHFTRNEAYFKEHDYNDIIDDELAKKEYA